MVAVIVVVIVLTVASLAVYLQAGNESRTTSVSTLVRTITTTVTYPCPASLATQTGTSTKSSTGNNTSNGGLNFGPLLGNFSAMTVVLYGNGSNGKSFTSSSMAVLNRSLTSSGPIYEVNVTTKSIERQVTVSGTQNTMTTIVSPGNITTVGSLLADVARNGSVVSTIGSSGNLSAPPLPLVFFAPLFLQNYSSSGSRAVSTSTITVGTTRMTVANWEPPTLVEVMVQDGCNSAPATIMILTISHQEVQAGQVPGTNFPLVTRYSQVYSIQSNSSTSSSSEFSVIEEVTGFTVA